MMKLISAITLNSNNVIPMHNMEDGQVAQVLNKDYIVLCIRHGNTGLFLVLDDNTATNSYLQSCSLPVQLLDPREEITITFSNKE